MEAPRDETERFRQALGAARACGWLAVLYGGLALVMAWLTLPGRAAAGPGGTERRFATWHLGPGVAFETPLAPALVAVTLPAVVAFAAGIWTLRASRRDPRRLPVALGVGAAAGGFGVLPGPFVTLSSEWTDGTSSAKLSSGGMAGIAFLFLAGAYLYTNLRHGRTLRAGDPGAP